MNKIETQYYVVFENFYSQSSSLFHRILKVVFYLTKIFTVIYREYKFYFKKNFILIFDSHSEEARNVCNLHNFHHFFILLILVSLIRSAISTSESLLLQYLITNKKSNLIHLAFVD